MVMAELESPACKQSKEQFWIIKDLALTARENLPGPLLKAADSSFRSASVLAT